MNNHCYFELNFKLKSVPKSVPTVPKCSKRKKFFGTAWNPARYTGYKLSVPKFQKILYIKKKLF